ncbi:MAG: choice-of-anchor D domain-containing protein, partial [Verrucomicrobiaceae bacterium]
MTNAVEAVDVSLASFSVNDQTFPAKGTMPRGWFKPSNVKNGWNLSKDGAYEGSHCLVAKTPMDGKTAGIAYRSNFRAGNVSFYVKVSSEEGYDHVRFYIDGVMQRMVGGSGPRGFSGDSDWTFFSFPVPSGNHTLQWTYEKDDSYSAFLDTAWVDGVSLPPTTQEISVQKPAGVEHEDGKTTNYFPETTVGFSSKAQTFIIKNRGKAELSDIKVSLTGANKGDFVVKAPSKKNLAPGASTKFVVRFAPTAEGVRKAGIRIVSSDTDEGKFGIKLEGTGLGAPVIGVSQPADNRLGDDSGVRNFGFATVGSTGNSRTFTIRNTGAEVLSGISISKSGKGWKDFKIGKPGSTSIAPG